MVLCKCEFLCQHYFNYENRKNHGLVSRKSIVLQVRDTKVKIFHFLVVCLFCTHKHLTGLSNIPLPKLIMRLRDRKKHFYCLIKNSLGNFKD